MACVIYLRRQIIPKFKISRENMQNAPSCMQEGAHRTQKQDNGQIRPNITETPSVTVSMQRFNAGTQAASKSSAVWRQYHVDSGLKPLTLQSAYSIAHKTCFVNGINNILSFFGVQIITAYEKHMTYYDTKSPKYVVKTVTYASVA